METQKPLLRGFVFFSVSSLSLKTCVVNADGTFSDTIQPNEYLELSTFQQVQKLCLKTAYNSQPRHVGAFTVVANYKFFLLVYSTNGHPSIRQ